MENELVNYFVFNLNGKLFWRVDNQFCELLHCSTIIIGEHIYINIKRHIENVMPLSDLIYKTNTQHTIFFSASHYQNVQIWKSLWIFVYFPIAVFSIKFTVFSSQLYQYHWFNTGARNGRVEKKIVQIITFNVSDG